MRRKIGIIGAGHVGAHVACALSEAELCEEIVLVDKLADKAWAQAVDLQDRAVYLGRDVLIREGELTDLGDADLCVLCACGEIFRENRLEELDEALDIVDEILPGLLAGGFGGTIVAITNPCDLVALYLQMKTELPVIGTGTALDSARFRVRIARGLGVAPDSVSGYCVGEHGDSQVQVWSQVTVGSRLLDELAAEQPQRYGQLDRAAVERSTTEAGWAIVKGKGSTEFGIGAAAAEVIRALLRGSNRILPCSLPYRPDAGSPLIYTSMPALIGAGGRLQALPLRLNAEEQARFEESCRLLERYRRECLEPRLPRVQ